MSAHTSRRRSLGRLVVAVGGLVALLALSTAPAQAAPPRRAYGYGRGYYNNVYRGPYRPVPYRGAYGGYGYGYRGYRGYVAPRPYVAPYYGGVVGPRVYGGYGYPRPY